MRPELLDERGISLVVVNTPKGEQLFSSLPISRTQCNLNEAIQYNTSLINSSPKPKVYDYFWQQYRKHGIKAIDKTLRKLRPSLTQRAMYKFKSIFKS